MICVKGVYYIATSTFEWFPGVEIQKSTDLIHWELAGRPLDRLSQLNMTGTAFSDGVWAPGLSYDGKKFYLVFTNVHSSQTEPFKDTPNFLVTSEKIEGPWSEPVYLNSSGFDPSLFHDSDGRKWLINMEWDFRKKEIVQRFGGILLQEYEEETRSLKGPVYRIFTGSEIGITEGPHLIKKEGYYYLITAEGGTSYHHVVTMARSRSILGPYELHPENPLLTSWEEESDDEQSELKRAGHGSICQGKDGIWYLAYLCGRPVPGTRRCIMGRETAVQPLIWKGGWPYLASGGKKPAVTFPMEAEQPRQTSSVRKYSFSDGLFWKDFQTLRLPADPAYIYVNDNKKCPTLVGRESIYSRFHQTLIARRQTDFCFRASTMMEFEPESYRHMAGLIYRYSEYNQYYLYKSFEEESGRAVLVLQQVDRGQSRILDQTVIPDEKILLGVEVHGARGQFYYQCGGEKREIGDRIDATILSDEYAEPRGFTGAFTGICVQDLLSQKKSADFTWFLYEYLEE